MLPAAATFVSVVTLHCAYHPQAHKANNTYYFAPYPGWETHIWIILGLAELFSLFCIMRVWKKRGHGPAWAAILKTLLLIIPLLGPLLYYFFIIDPLAQVRHKRN